MSLTKDILILSHAMRYEPDLIVWLVTLESFPYDKQLFPPLLQNNPEPVRRLIAAYRLNLDPQSTDFRHFTCLGSHIDRVQTTTGGLVSFATLWGALGGYWHRSGNPINLRSPAGRPGCGSGISRLEPTQPEIHGSGDRPVGCRCIDRRQRSHRAGERTDVHQPGNQQRCALQFLLSALGLR